MRKVLMLAALCAVSGALHAQTAPVPTSQKPVKEKKLCRREEATGSIMTTSVCHTKDEWTQIDAANARAVDQFNTLRRTGHSAGGSGN
ncbi:MAG: hypothetical protein JF628_16030 [Sphingomonas sp.]|nr:hypothetical protein [Sphingomonas sp.]